MGRAETWSNFTLFLLLPQLFKLVPVPDSGDTRTFKTHQQMTHLPLEVAKIKVLLLWRERAWIPNWSNQRTVSGMVWLWVSHVGRNWANNGTAIQVKTYSRSQKAVRCRLTGILMFLFLSWDSAQIHSLETRNIYLNVQSLDDSLLCWTWDNCQGPSSPPYSPGTLVSLPFFFDIEEQNLLLHWEKVERLQVPQTDVKPRLRFIHYIVVNK